MPYKSTLSAAGRIPSDFNMAANSDVSTVGNTYETVLSYSGAGKVSAVAFASAAADKVLAFLEVTVDGGTLTETDMATHFIAAGGGYLWAREATNGQNNIINVDIPFKVSILIRAKNDTNTNAIAVGVAYTKDQ
tara:strand:+ start:301 stop:702 length:402 start_codon:yes stop_codon:yes gene_type:complete